MKKNDAVLTINQVKKNFKNPRDKKSFAILNNINLKVVAGKTIAIVGKSGSGKSTLLSLIAGLDEPSSGEIIIQGQDINQLSERALTTFRAQHISIIFQQFQLINHLNVLDNVILPLYLTEQFNPSAKERAIQLLEEIDLKERINFFPKELSGGEQQRVAIARSLIVEPQIILADEPTGNLDVKTGNKVIEQFFNLVKKKKKTLILVTHDLALAEKCQEIYHIKNNTLSLQK